jgi:hypothetical protein
MKNEIEVIDGIKGEWRTVTRPEDVTVGQRVRYGINELEWGICDKRMISIRPSGEVISTNKEGELSSENIFDGFWKNIQAFFPLADKPKRKVAKVRIEEENYYWIEIQGMNLRSHYYVRRSNAIRGAKRFCAAIGYECEIVK